MDDPFATRPQPHPWLLLIHQVPPKPDYLRVKIRRRVLRIGAVQLKNTVYAVHNTADALEDLQWIRQEILGMGGTALICEASFLTAFGDTASVAQVTPGTTWITRTGVFIDRIACAWLIRRFIDPQARFKFVPAQGYQPMPGEVRFDMYDAEFTHEGDRCTFQTLLQRFALDDVALNAIGEIVRDIDYKADTHARAETSGVATLIRGIAQQHQDDEARLERGAALFDDLYAAFNGASQ